jgi:putative inorganic carbon (HCO3(-)) transporter
MALRDTGERLKPAAEAHLHSVLKSLPHRRDKLLLGAMIALLGILIGGYTIGVAYIPEEWGLVSLVAVVGFFILVIVGKLRPVLLAALLLDIPLQLDIYLGFIEPLDQVTFTNGYNLSVTTGVLAVLYVTWFAEIVIKREQLPAHFAKAATPLLAYFGFAALSMLVAPNFKYSTMDLFLLAQMILVYVYIVGTVRTESELRLITLFLMIGLILESLTMIGIRLHGKSLELPIVLIRIYDNMRVGGTVGSPNEAGAYLAMMLAITLGVFFTQTKRWFKVIAIPAFALGLVAILLTGSRGAWMGLCLATIATYVLLWHRVGRSALALVIVPAVLLIILYLFRDSLLQRLLGDDHGAAAARWPLIKLAFLMAIRNPILGVGLNNFVFVAPDYLTFQLSQAWFSTVHNKYMLIWSETGTGGLIAFVWFLGVTLRRGWQISRSKIQTLSSLATGYTAAVVAAAVHMMVEIYQGRAEMQMFLVAAAVVTAISIIQAVDAPQSSASAVTTAPGFPLVDAS